jgi:paraquat-inducible protein B
MDEPANATAPSPEDLPSPAIRRGRPSLVWLIPLVAAVIGAWMAVKAFTQRGPTITITFQSAEGLEAGQTRIRYMDVEVGKVTDLSLSPDFSKVVVTAELTQAAKPLLSENSRFWVVRASIGTNGISGLGTLVSGAYIGMDPGPHSRMSQAFKGLDVAPPLPPHLPGELIELRADQLGSLNLGSPVTFRQVHVGEVAGFDLDPEGRSVLIKVLVHAPYLALIHRDTRFWNSGGVDLTLDANGLRLRTDSLVQLVLGGIAFENPLKPEPELAIPEGQPFTLYPNRDQAYEKTYRDRQLFVLHFEESVRGLEPGAPVTFRGLRVGQVESLRLEFHPGEPEGRIPVLIALEPERFSHAGALEPLLAQMVRKGLRAQLKNGSMLTGNLYVDLDFHPQVKPGLLGRSGSYHELPTLPSTLGALLDNLARLAERLQGLPLEDTADQLRATLPVLRDTLQQSRALITHLDTETAPQVKATLAQAQTTLATLERTLRTDSPAQSDLHQALAEFARASRALRNLADTLERHPESLLFGKGKTP